ncbi:MAG: hypothetical protein NHB32_25725 [Fischerella sp. CENA71]|nr:hypothetical protein [Fischerella sp. CENA71]
MLKRRTILVCLTVLGLTLAVSTKVHGQSTGEAWETVYNEAVAGATTIITVPLLDLLLSSILQVFFKLGGFWGG